MSDIMSIGDALTELSARIQTERGRVEEERDVLLQALNGVRNMMVAAADRLASLEKEINAAHDGRVSVLTQMIGGNAEPVDPTKPF